MIDGSLTNAEYHASPGISKSGLDLIAKSPAHYFARYLDPQRPPAPEATHAQLAGTLAHCAILEPAEFSRRYAIGPDTTRAAKAWKEFEASLPAGMIAIKAEDHARAFAQAESLRRLPDIAEALSRGAPEVSVFWRDAETGVLCKCRPDWSHDCGDAGVVLVDVKTCGSASPSEFVREAARHRYHVQAAWYSDGFTEATGRDVLGFLLAAVESEYPFAAAPIMLDAESIDQGRREYRRNLDTYAACVASGEWPGYGAGVHLVTLPKWAFTE
ncbi:MAG TPA: PD-(D/E)XK nuclease-like domain-containing protein [Sulfuricaulis sp.]|nr:PD-(D/E)XK nuclease-like domain-containing protein [Sulfuricaulis sp.]